MTDPNCLHPHGFDKTVLSIYPGIQFVFLLVPTPYILIIISHSGLFYNLMWQLTHGSTGSNTHAHIYRACCHPLLCSERNQLIHFGKGTKDRKTFHASTSLIFRLFGGFVFFFSFFKKRLGPQVPADQQILVVSLSCCQWKEVSKMLRHSVLTG